jgi:hypothetical protein
MSSTSAASLGDLARFGCFHYGSRPRCGNKEPLPNWRGEFCDTDDRRVQLARCSSPRKCKDINLPLAALFQVILERRREVRFGTKMLLRKYRLSAEDTCPHCAIPAPEWSLAIQN